MPIAAFDTQRPTGIRVRHTGGWTNQLYVLEDPNHRYADGGYACNLCIGTHHHGKTTHLWLEADGGCLVSTGVYEQLKTLGMPQLEYAGVTHNPPPLRLRRGGANRASQDNDNRTIHVLPHIPNLTGDTG